MTIKHHFETETISEQDVFLDNDEEIELISWLEELIKHQVAAQDVAGDFDQENAMNLAALAFVAGRSYQKVIDAEAGGVVEGPQQVDLRIDAVTAGRLLEFLLKGD
jgi:hypothetical protein